MTAPKMRRLLGCTAAAVALVLSSLPGAASASASGSPARPGPRTADRTAGLAALRAATQQFHDVHVATHSHYGRFVDINGVACIAEPGMGAMGVHFVDGALVGDPAIVANQPEALVYSHGPHGELRLAAVEYIVVKDAWDATHASPPRLFGHRFNLTLAPNRFGLPTFYSLHVWVWQDNPAGLFAMWNPRVQCPTKGAAPGM